MRRPQRIEKTCLSCKAVFSLPPCNDWREHCCSSECKKQHAQNKTNSRARSCLNCKKRFIPRQYQLDHGAGFYCSVFCHNTRGGITRTEETKRKMSVAQKESIKAGRRVIKSGADHPLWQGGKPATYERLKAELVLKHKLWRQADPRRMRGHNAVKRNLTAPDKCEHCGGVARLHGHHPDYDKPLEVIWLCPSCHMIEHKRSA